MGAFTLLVIEWMDCASFKTVIRTIEKKEPYVACVEDVYGSNLLIVLQ